MVRLGGDIDGIELEQGDTITINGETWTGTHDNEAHSETYLTEADLDGGSTSGYAGSETIVTDAANLQSAVDNNGHVRISGRLDVTSVSPIDVPDDVCIEGFGTWRDVDWREYSDAIVDNSTGPAILASGNNVRLRGFGVHQQATDGEAIRSTGYSTNISEIDVHSEGHGIRCMSPDGTEVPTEPRIYDCRIRSESGGGSGTNGVWIEQMYDSKIIDNIICGFDININVEQNSQFINGNHTYTHPAASHTVALRIDAGYVRVTDNRFEDAPTDAGIQLVSDGYVLISDNLFQMGDGTDAIRAEHTGEQNLSIIKNNMLFAYDDGVGGTAIDFSSTTGFWRSYISDNAIYNFSNEGTTDVGSSDGSGEMGETGTSHTFNVPSDFATVSDAFDYIDTMYQTRGRSITINIEADHELQDYVSRAQSDYRNVIVESEDDVVPVASTFPDRHVFQFQDYCVAPTFRILIDGQGHGYTGYNILFGSEIHFDDTDGTVGARNCDVGLACNQRSRAYGDNVDFSNASYRGCMVNNGSVAMLHNTDFSGATDYGLRISASRVDCLGGDMTNCGQQGLRANQSATVHARICDVSGSGGHGVSLSMNASAALEGVTAQNCDGNGILVDASRAYTRDMTTGGNGGDDGHVDNGGIITHGAPFGSTNISTNTLSGNGIIFES